VIAKKLKAYRCDKIRIINHKTKMLDKLIHILPGHRHRFRHMTFDELGEIYTSMMLRGLAMSMAGIFIPIYLYQYGYEIWQIFTFYALAFFVMSLMSIPVSLLVGKIGPKHNILLSYLLLIVALTALIKIDTFGNYLLIAIMYGLSNIIFFTAYHVDFSKVKHSKNGGSELGMAYIMERIGGILGPLVGGIVAFVFAPQYTFLVSVVVLFMASLPLFFTKEPVQLNQHIDYKQLKIGKIKRDLLSYSFLVTDTAVSNVIWPFFIGVIIFTDNAYLQVGSITSIGLITAVLAAKSIGKIIDNKKGRNLFRFSVVCNSVIHILRSLTAGYPMALTLNLSSEVVATGFRMPYFKGMYDAADDHPGSRIVYVGLMELVSTFVRALFFAVVALCAYFIIPDRGFFMVVFFAAAIASLFMMTERFPALKPRRLHKT